VLQLLRGVALMAGAVKRSAMARRVTAAAAYWSLTVCWMHAVMIVAAVSELEEGQLLSFGFILLSDACESLFARESSAYSEEKIN